MIFNQDENQKDTSFISEKIKQRPINKKKLIRRTIITVSLALVFGLVACLTFLLLQPLLSDKLYPESQPEPVTFPEQPASDELTPEEMFADDNEIAASEAMSNAENQKNQIDQAIASYSYSQSDYGKLMASLKLVSDEASKSIVRVSGVKNDNSLFTDSIENSGSSGVIIENKNSTLFILAPHSALKDAKKIRITFCDNTYTEETELCLVDSITNLCVISVKLSDLQEHTKNSITTSELGSSNSVNLTGVPVIALGSPIGIQNSVSYGIITSDTKPLDLADSNYKLITTDMSGSSNGSGVLVGLDGQVLGIIDMHYAPDDLPNNICAIAITEIKPLLADLSNKKARAHFGIHGTTVPLDKQKSNNIPAGAYVTSTEMNSPAMKSGIQSGDIITKIGSDSITSFNQFVDKLAEYSPDDIITVTVMRESPNSYIELSPIKIKLESATHD
ncbi:MAG: serine protease [Butyrivibrio sp.]|nr:serine protease [Butyrivibrio sp.]